MYKGNLKTNPNTYSDSHASVSLSRWESHASLNSQAHAVTRPRLWISQIFFPFVSISPSLLQWLHQSSSMELIFLFLCFWFLINWFWISEIWVFIFSPFVSVSPSLLQWLHQTSGIEINQFPLLLIFDYLILNFWNLGFFFLWSQSRPLGPSFVLCALRHNVLCYQMNLKT